MTTLLRVALLAVMLSACAPSPEARRERGGGPGADVLNRGGELEMHEGSVIYYSTPCLTTLSECTGPMPQRTARRS